MSTKEITTVVKTRRQILREHILKNREWFFLRGMLSYSWAMFLFLIGGRMAGKSYAVTHFFVGQWRKWHRPFYWLRLTDKTASDLLRNNAENLIDPDIRRYYKLDLVTIGNEVYEVTKRAKPREDGRPGKILKKELMARVMALSNFYNDKGQAYYDKDFLNDPNMYYNICLDEMMREQGERNSFDIVKSFAGQMENIVRTTKKRIRIICVGNFLEEASDILTAFNFLPEEFGRYKLKAKKAAIDYMEPTEKEKDRRRGSAYDILSGGDSNVTNAIDTDRTLICKKRLKKPSYVIAFTNTEKFTVWDDNIVSEYKNENTARVIAMRPYLDYLFEVKARDVVINLFDTRSYRFRNLVTQKIFKKNLALLKPRK